MIRSVVVDAPTRILTWRGKNYGITVVVPR